MKPKILVFIPTYRCETQIRRVLKQFDAGVQQWIHTVLIVDNQSPDQTLDVAIEVGKSIFTHSAFIAWRNEDNYGLGGSHKVAFKYGIEENFDFLVVLHGDDQADIHDLVPQLEAEAHLNVDCLLGARFMRYSRRKGYSWFRTFGNIVYNTLFSLVVRRRIYDLGSGLNLYRLKSFSQFYYNTFPDDLTFNYVMLLASFFRKQKLQFFPISWREEDQRSNVKLLYQSVKVLRLLARYAKKPSHFLCSELRVRAFEIYSGKICFKHEKHSK